MSDGIPMTILYETSIPNDMIPDFWDMLSVSGYFGAVNYGQWDGAMRGYGPSGWRPVPRWAKVALWWKSLWRRGPVSVRGPKEPAADWTTIHVKVPADFKVIDRTRLDP